MSNHACGSLYHIVWSLEHHTAWLRNRWMLLLPKDVWQSQDFGESNYLAGNELISSESAIE